ncbi:MAG: MFS transporter [Burkholderiales bacterium]|nr:MFS transporter [Burkholderiales bacterium]
MSNVTALNKEEKRVLLLSSLGGMLELYDFAIYGAFATYFAKQFFPNQDGFIGILETYMVFLLGFILRPIGGMIFSHIGDEKGRKKVLVYTVFLMGISSLGIAILPTYAQIGIVAPVLLMLMRMLQGLAVGGELPTTFVYISEYMPNKRIFAFSVVMGGVFSGYLLASLVNFILSEICTEDFIYQYGWRIPFVIGSVLCLLSFKIRKSLHETDAFEQIKTKEKFPILMVLRQHKIPLIAGAFMSAAQQVFSVVGIIYMPTYLNKLLNVSNTLIAQISTMGLFLFVLMIIILGVYFKNKSTNLVKILLCGLLINIITIPLAFYSMKHNLFVLGYSLLLLPHSIFGLFIPLCITLLFPANVRLSGVSLSYNISIVIFAGTAPLLITALINYTQLTFFAPAMYMILFLILGCSAMCLMFRKLYYR